jgi:hypothetical protein
MTNPLTNGAGLSGLSTEELRAAVRAVLRDVLPDLGTGRTASSDEPAVPAQDVVLSTDADLDAFVRRLAALCDDPERRAAFQQGRHSFRLSTNGASKAAPAAAEGNGVVRIERGAVTERTVVKAAADGARLVLGRGAVLTPLARDRARSLGVEIVKES